MRIPTFLSLFLILFGLAAQAESKRYVALVIGTEHFGTDDFNDNTPGLTYGKRWDGKRAGTEWFIEGGVFYNSYEEVSPIALYGTSTSLVQLGSFDIRAGVAVGTGYYGELSERLKARYNIPNIGGFIPLVAANVSVHNGPHAVRFTTLPVDEDVDFLLNLSYAYSF